MAISSPTVVKGSGQKRDLVDSLMQGVQMGAQLQQLAQTWEQQKMDRGKLNLDAHFEAAQASGSFAGYFDNPKIKASVIGSFEDIGNADPEGAYQGLLNMEKSSAEKIEEAYSHSLELLDPEANLNLAKEVQSGLPGKVLETGTKSEETEQTDPEQLIVKHQAKVGVPIEGSGKDPSPELGTTLYPPVGIGGPRIYYKDANVETDIGQVDANHNWVPSEGFDEVKDADVIRTFEENFGEGTKDFVYGQYREGVEKSNGTPVSKENFYKKRPGEKQSTFRSFVKSKDALLLKPIERSPTQTIIYDSKVPKVVTKTIEKHEKSAFDKLNKSGRLFGIGGLPGDLKTGKEVTKEVTKEDTETPSDYLEYNEAIKDAAIDLGYKTKTIMASKKSYDAYVDHLHRIVTNAGGIEAVAKVASPMNMQLAQLTATMMAGEKRWENTIKELAIRQKYKLEAGAEEFKWQVLLMNMKNAGLTVNPDSGQTLVNATMARMTEATKNRGVFGLIDRSYADAWNNNHGNFRGNFYGYLTGMAAIAGVSEKHIANKMGFAKLEDLLKAETMPFSEEEMKGIFSSTTQEQTQVTQEAADAFIDDFITKGIK